jgi:serine/threonine protein kinase
MYAMKSLKKDVLIDQDQIENTLLEKNILQSIDHKFLVGLVFCFQTVERIYFIMPFLRGGELFQHLRKLRIFDEDKYFSIKLGYVSMPLKSPWLWSISILMALSIETLNQKTFYLMRQVT